MAQYCPEASPRAVNFLNQLARGLDVEVPLGSDARDLACYLAYGTSTGDDVLIFNALYSAFARYGRVDQHGNLVSPVTLRQALALVQQYGGAVRDPGLRNALQSAIQDAHLVNEDLPPMLV